MALAGTHIEVNGLRIYSKSMARANRWCSFTAEPLPPRLGHRTCQPSPSTSGFIPPTAAWQDRQPDGRTRLPRNGG